MTDLSQGDIIKIGGYSHKFIVISRNAFIRATGVFHVCPLLGPVADGPLHIVVTGQNGTSGTVICEQIKLIDPAVRSCNRIDSLRYDDVMNISDAIQGIFEYN